MTAMPNRITAVEARLRMNKRDNGIVGDLMEIVEQKVRQQENTAHLNVTMDDSESVNEAVVELRDELGYSVNVKDGVLSVTW